jgi:hypothetical protein
MAVGNGMGIGIPMVNLGLGGGGGGGASFLLDDYPNTSGHSYSLRQLSSTVTNVVRVRRGSDNTEQDFTAAGITDGTLATFCGGSEGFVAKWYDQSGNSDVLNFTALQQPKIFVEDGIGGYEVLLQNGKPCMEFDGVDDSLQVLISLPPVNRAYYLFAVNTLVSAPGLGEPEVYMYGLKADVPAPFDGKNSIKWGAGSSGSFYGSSSLGFGASQGTQYLYYARQQSAPGPFSGSTIKVNLTQNPISGFADNGAAPINTITLGDNPNNYAGQHSNIKLQEFILYFTDPALNGTAIESNINTHYSIY